MPKYTECYDGETLNTFTTIGSDNSLLNYSGRKYVIYWKSLFQDIFMPRGYPQSVSPDYASYQLWDTVQAFASSMNSALATEAVLRGAGVGNEAASTMAAAIAWLLRDGIGMIARILFAWFYSPYLDADCKQWRLVADCFNDLASCLDLITPIFPNLFTLIICLSSMLRAVVGVAGSATRTTVTNHQAISDNVGDVAAKDGSQETLVNVFALLCSLLLLPIVSGNVARVWLLFALFTLIHLYGNYRAVKSLQFRTLNQSLLRIIVKVIHDLKTNCGYVSMAKMSDTADQLRAALCMELMLNTKTVPSSAELNEFVDKLKEGGWLINKHRLVFDRWTYCEK